MEFLGNLILLIVGGNDTTRNSISGGVLALNENPGEYDKLRGPLLILNMVSEIIRRQTPRLYAPYGDRSGVSWSANAQGRQIGYVVCLGQP